MAHRSRISLPVASVLLAFLLQAPVSQALQKPTILVRVAMNAGAPLARRLDTEQGHPPDYAQALEAGLATSLKQLPLFQYASDRGATSVGGVAPPRLWFVLESVPNPWPRGDVVMTVGIEDVAAPPPQRTTAPDGTRWLPGKILVLERPADDLAPMSQDLKSLSWLTSKVDGLVGDASFQRLLSDVPIAATANLRRAPGTVQTSESFGFAPPGLFVFGIRWNDASRGRMLIPFVSCLPDRIGGPLISAETFAEASCPPLVAGRLPPAAPTSSSSIYLLRFRQGVR